MDVDNPVIQLCVQGITAEKDGRVEDARRLYREAWEARADDFDACVAAHYVARLQDTPEDGLRWNQEALERAIAVDDERVHGFFPSLHLNLGFSKELLGDIEGAKRHYDIAAQGLDDLPPGPHTEVVRRGVADAQRRMAIK